MKADQYKRTMERRERSMNALMRRIDDVERRFDAYMLFVLDAIAANTRRTQLSAEKEHTASRRSPPLALELRDAFAAHGHVARSEADLERLERAFDHALVRTDADVTAAAALFNKWCMSLPRRSSTEDLLLIAMHTP